MPILRRPHCSEPSQIQPVCDEMAADICIPIACYDKNKTSEQLYSYPLEYASTLYFT
jgi:hypothetical protein